MWVQVPPPAPKRPMGLFFVGGTFVLCTTNALRLEPTLVWLAPVFASPSAESSCHLTARPTTRTKKTSGSFFCWWDFVLYTTNVLRLEPTLVWLAPVSPCPSAESSCHLTAHPTTRTKKTSGSFFCWWNFIVIIFASFSSLVNICCLYNSILDIFPLFNHILIIILI